MHFTKMHGLGNDYVYVDCFKEKIEEPEKLAVAVSDRHFGAGSDGLILICPSQKADCRMSMYNADGSVGKMCGNGIRCVGRYVYERGIAKKTPITVETLAGIKTLYMDIHGGTVRSVTVNMGTPEVAGVKELKAGECSYHVWDVSMGNPHGVVFLRNADSHPKINQNETEGDKADGGGEYSAAADTSNAVNDVLSADFPVNRIGQLLEKNPAFPDGANIEFVEIIDRTHIRMRVWERGSGETLACGTGACACVAAGIASGFTQRNVTVSLRGGDLEVCLKQDGCIYMTGPAEFVYEGEWNV